MNRRNQLWPTAIVRFLPFHLEVQSLKDYLFLNLHEPTTFVIIFDKKSGNQWINVHLEIIRKMVWWLYQRRRKTYDSTSIYMMKQVANKKINFVLCNKQTIIRAVAENIGCMGNNNWIFYPCDRRYRQKPP